MPKKHCLKIIDELEPVGRGCYTGSDEHISACGSLKLNILSRSFLRYGNHLSDQTWAGSVVDSLPDQECFESMAKGQALHKVLQQALK